MIAVVWSDLWSQFAALAAALLLLAALSKVPFIQTLFRRNVSDPFREWLKEVLHPTNMRIDKVNARVSELADYLDYEFSANGGSSMRDRVNAGVEAAGGPEDPRSIGTEHHDG